MEAISESAERVASLGPRTVVMLVVSVVFLVLTWVAFALRVYVRGFMIRSFGKDDWTMLLTLGLFTSCCALLISVEQFEQGDRPRRAIEEGPIAELELLNHIMKYVVSLMGLYILTTITLKISLAIFFLRVVIQKWQRRVIYITIGIYTVYGLMFAFLAVFQCGVPTHFLIKEATGMCVRDDILQPLNYLHGSLNAASDWLFAILPIFVLWNSKIPRSAKISSGLLLSLGAIGSISSLIRLAYVPGLKNGPVFFSNAINIGIWSVIEPGLGIVAASLATLRPLFKSMVEKARNTTNSSSRSNNSRDSKLSSQRKPIYSGINFSERGYLQMDHKQPRTMGNFTTMEGDMKSQPSSQTYEISDLDTVPERSSPLNSIRSGSSIEMSMIPPGPVTIGSLQNKHWFPDDEVLMTRHVDIYDEEAGSWVQRRAT